MMRPDAAPDSFGSFEKPSFRQLAKGGFLALITAAVLLVLENVEKFPINFEYGIKEPELRADIHIRNDFSVRIEVVAYDRSLRLQ
ncbi:hypothetical protein [Paenibacillus thailandensis]|uniref:DUF4179 domain-containing protein n=1 Tax=Paenibacillus thailandensis TaxID=393250 RepID=A0ABW5QRE9_9BACL